MSKYILDAAEARRLATNELHAHMSWMAQTSWLSPDDWAEMSEWWAETDQLLPSEGEYSPEVVNAILMFLDEREWAFRENGSFFEIDRAFGQALRRALAKAKE